MQATVGASTITLSGLLWHLAYAEDRWFWQSIDGGTKRPRRNPVAWRAGLDWESPSATQDSPERLRALRRQARERSRSLAAEALAQGGPKQPARRTWPSSEAPSAGYWFA